MGTWITNPTKRLMDKLAEIFEVEIEELLADE